MTTKLSLEAGAELDDMIATKIVGIKKARGIWRCWNLPPRWFFYDPDQHRQYLNGPVESLPFVYETWPGEIGSQPPPYSTDEQWAFRLVEFMRKDGFSFKLWQPSNYQILGGDPWRENAVVSFVCGMGPCERHGNKVESHHGAYDIEAETVPLAIARAAVLARKVTG